MKEYDSASSENASETISLFYAFVRGTLNLLGRDGSESNSGEATSSSSSSEKTVPKMLADTSRQEWTDEKLQQIFNRLDSNGNGTLERVEILKAASSDKDLAHFITPSSSNQAYSTMANGQAVDFEKFKLFCRKASSSKLVSVQADGSE